MKQTAGLLEGTEKYVQVNSANATTGTLVAWSYEDMETPEWDEFLDSVPGSHFFQTSMWAETRKIDGWQPLITTVTLNNQIIGGFQILMKSKKYLGRIGFLLKGPVLASGHKGEQWFLVQSMVKVIKHNRISALLIQPSDGDADILPVLKKSGFSENRLDGIIKINTIQVDLTRDEDAILRSLKSQKRRDIRSASRAGITVREGDQNEISVFFSFMLETCTRQQVRPSPSSESFLRHMWNLFSLRNNIKLFIAEYKGNYVSTFMVILFAGTAFLWKFGWSGEYRQFHPNDLLYWEVFKWAKERGFRLADLGAIDADLMSALLENQNISERMTKTYSYFKSGFGGNIVQLSKGLIYIPNRLIRLMHNILSPYINSTPFLKRRILFAGE